MVGGAGVGAPGPGKTVAEIKQLLEGLRHSSGKTSCVCVNIPFVVVVCVDRRWL